MTTEPEAIAPLLPGLTSKDHIRLGRVLASITQAEARTAAANARAAVAKTTRARTARAKAAKSRAAKAKASKAKAAEADAATAAQLQVAAPVPAELLPICRHVMPSGRRCRAIRHNRTSYCYFHEKHRDRVNRRHGPAYNLAHLPMLEDRASIQVALDETLRGLIRGNINDRKAGLLLYGIQIAFQNVRGLDKDMISADSLPSSTDIEHDELPVVPFTDEEEAAYNAEKAENAGRDDGWDAAVAACKKNLPPDPQLSLWPEDESDRQAAPSPLSAHSSAQIRQSAIGSFREYC